MIKCAIFAFYFNHSFFRYLCGKTAKDDFTDRLSALVERVKMNAQWRHRYMTIEQEIKLQARNLAKDMAKDIANDIASEKTLETAKKMIAANLGTAEQIASVTGLSLEQVKSLKTGKS